jgi:hypothetical protein
LCENIKKNGFVMDKDRKLIKQGQSQLKNRGTLFLLTLAPLNQHLIDQFYLVVGRL